MYLLVTISVGLTLTSCHSKEERFINDMRVLVEKAEQTDNPTELQAVIVEVGILESKYGKNWEPKFTVEQEAEIVELSTRFAAACIQGYEH